MTLKRGQSRREIIISAPLDAWLVKEATRIGLNVSEFVRRILDEKRGVEPKKDSR